MRPLDHAYTLLKKYSMYRVTIDSANVHGYKIKPNLNTITKELYAFIAALKKID